MTLLDFVAALTTQNVSVKVKDGDTDAVLIEFKSAGISGVESDLSARTVRRWTIDGSTAITVVLDAA